MKFEIRAASNNMSKHICSLRQFGLTKTKYAVHTAYDVTDDYDDDDVVFEEKYHIELNTLEDIIALNEALQKQIIIDSFDMSDEIIDIPVLKIYDDWLE